MRQKNTDLKDVWETPPEIIDLISEQIDLDPCAGRTTSIARTNFRNIHANGLIENWAGTVFVNPPFSDKGEWLEKVVEESKTENVECIYFVSPDSTDTKSWWHKYIAQYADYIWFSKGRINYISPKGMEPKPEKKTETDSVTFGTAISIFGEPSEQTLRNMNRTGQLVVSYDSPDEE